MRAQTSGSVDPNTLFLQGVERAFSRIQHPIISKE